MDHLAGLKRQHDAEADHTNRAIIDCQMEKAMPKKKVPAKPAEDTPKYTFNEIEAGVMQVDDVWVACVRVGGGEPLISEPFATEEEARAQMHFARKVTQAVMLGAGMTFMVVPGGGRGN